MQKILLDSNILSMPCYIVSKVNGDNSSTTHSSISGGGAKSTLVFNELVELIH